MLPLTETELPRRMRRRRRGINRPVLIALVTVILLFAAGYYLQSGPGLPGLSAPPDQSELSHDPPAAIPRIALATEVMPISREEAERLNGLRGAEVQTITAARPFTVKDSFRADPRFQSALDCLTQAVYYEAASEPDPGQRAVAQVVLNRVRHPGFPHSVCGVVYQGAELPTGCQFTFTCDGSLLRQPSRGGWARARKVALAALSGWVEAPVGLSTHYHATYVVPYWASSLDKVTLIGSHIFYSLPRQGGGLAAFQAKYDFADEYAPALAAVPLVATPADDGTGAPRIEPMSVLGGSNGLPPGPAAGTTLQADRSGTIAAEEPSPTLQADRQHGELTVRGSNSTLLAD